MNKKITSILLGITAMPAVSSAAVIYSNVTSYEWDLTDSVGADVTGNVTRPNEPSSTISDPRSDGSSSVLFQGIIDATSGGSSLSVTHQNDGTIPNFPANTHRVQSTLTQVINFVAEPGDGNFSFAGTIIANPTAGTPGTATALFQLRNLTTSTLLINSTITNGQIPGSSIAAVGLSAGDLYEVTYQTVNDKEATAITFGGSINSGGTLTYNLTGGTNDVWSYDASAIPEPSSVAALGVAGLFFLGRRRRS